MAVGCILRDSGGLELLEIVSYRYHVLLRVTCEMIVVCPSL